MELQEFIAREKMKNVPHPICPINCYFEGDEDKCDVTKCNYSTETRSCSSACRIPVIEIDGHRIPIVGTIGDGGVVTFFDKGNKNMAGDKTQRHGHPMFYELLEQMADLHSRKNHDYSGTKEPLKNLKSAIRLGIDPVTAIIIRLQDKWSRLEEFTKKGILEVKDESIEDTLMDNAVYSLLAIILRREQKKSEKPKIINDGHGL